jgi:hypothetical protein
VALCFTDLTIYRSTCSTGTSADIFRKGFQMHTSEVYEYLKKHGQLLDLEIAAATGIPLADVRTSLSQLSAQGDISRCSVTSYTNGKPVEGFQCRIAGFIPRPAPGRKPGVKPPTLK